MESEIDMVIANENFKADRIDALQAQIQAVARARQDAQELNDALTASRLQWDRENVDRIDALKIRKSIVDTEEAKLRELTLAIYAETKNKHPAPEVSIREVTQLKYDPSQAFSWATEHKMALKLDVPAYEKIVKATPSAFPLVELVTVATATIAQNIPVEESKEKK